MRNQYDNGDRLDAVTEKEWREALDELTAYLTFLVFHQNVPKNHKVP